MVRLCAILIGSLIISGCAGGSLKPTVPSKEDGRRACPTSVGTIIDIQEVTIEGNTEMAQGMGAAVGAYAGNRAAKNESELVEIAATVAGAAVGNMAGDVTSKTILSKPGTELLVYIDGTTHSIVQETDVRQPYAVGDDVWVVGNLHSAPQTRSQWNSRYGKQPNTGCKSGVRVLIKR